MSRGLCVGWPSLFAPRAAESTISVCCRFGGPKVVRIRPKGSDLGRLSTFPNGQLRVLALAALSRSPVDAFMALTLMFMSFCAIACSKKCDLESSLNRARFWLHADNHIEPGEEIGNRAYFHARDSDLP